MVVGNRPQLHTTQYSKRNQDQPTLRIDADVRGGGHVPDEPFVPPIGNQVYGRIGPTREQNAAVGKHLEPVPLPMTTVEHCARRVTVVERVKLAMELIERDVQPALSG